MTTAYVSSDLYNHYLSLGPRQQAAMLADMELDCEPDDLQVTPDESGYTLFDGVDDEKALQTTV